jgi:protein-S-isoprenylcysteine O-methyltransferase Ste14
MENSSTPLFALAGYAVFLLLAFGLRAWVHLRRTGTTGFVGISGRVGSVEWCGGALFAVAVVGGVAAPALQLSGLVDPVPALTDAPVAAMGAMLWAVGVAGTLWAQFAMGDSWRIGVDEHERTQLVLAGPFRWVRNPIYTAMTTASAGLTLLAPNPVAFAALAALVAAIEVQVRLVEEPYLARAHGDSYLRWAAATGRFLPGLGRMPPDQLLRC